MTLLIALLVAAPAIVFLYAYVAYPAMLGLLAALRPSASETTDPDGWPLLSITVPAYNAEGSLRVTLESLLAADYPADRRQILVVSDASTDGTDAIAAEYADRGVEVLRLPTRRGKTAAENAAAAAVRGDIVVNTDASIVIPRGSLKALVRAFNDEGVGVASGRDVSTGDVDAEGNQAESGYVGYEMWVRGLETRLGSIVGASGCFYGFRRGLYDTRFPEELSRDFASALIARRAGFRAVSVDAATCIVPRTSALHAEFRRKVRTMARGLRTLWYMRDLMNPVRHRGFAVALISHKLARWLVYPALPLSVLGLILWSVRSRVGLFAVGLASIGVILGAVGLRWPRGRKVPAIFAIPGFVLASNLAGIMAWIQVLRGSTNSIWEPTRRPA